MQIFYGTKQQVSKPVILQKMDLSEVKHLDLYF